MSNSNSKLPSVAIRTPRRGTTRGPSPPIEKIWLLLLQLSSPSYVAFSLSKRTVQYIYFNQTCSMICASLKAQCVRQVGEGAGKPPANPEGVVQRCCQVFGLADVSLAFTGPSSANRQNSSKIDRSGRRDEQTLANKMWEGYVTVILMSG